MSHVWSCGDENNDNQSGREWDTLTGTGGSSVGTPVHGGNAFGQRAWQASHAVAGITHQQHQFGASGNSGSKFWYATAVLWDTLPGAECAFIQILGPIAAFLESRLTTGGIIRLYRSDTSVQLGSDGPTLSTGTYYWIVLSYNGGDGAAELYVAETGKALTLRASGTAAITQSSVRIRRGIITSTTGKIVFDDAVVNNASGTVNNTIPQETFIQAHRPNAAGDINECSAGGFAEVDEVTSDEATTLAVFDADNDDLDVNIEPANVIVASLPLNLRIPFADVMVRERAASAAAQIWNARLKTQASGTVGTGPANTHNDTTFQTNGDAAPRIPYASETDPQNGAPHALSRIAAWQIGVTATDATPDVEVTQMWANVAYEYMAVRLNPPPVMTPNALGMINDLLLKVA
jgi:hypothetical protein